MKKRDLRNLRIVAWIGFVIYLIAMVYFLFFCEKMGRVSGVDYRYNLKPFAEIRRCLQYIYTDRYRYSMTLNLFGNVGCFVPLGFVLPFLSSKRWSFIKVTLLSVSASVLIEVMQLITKLGCCDIDDVILNTCGGMLGYILFLLCRGIYRLVTKRKTV
ncbi:MAG: VanZ family protein [Lachnospiraceae bacterium]|nr:VanZ family protein [Lachnospiraceae bacterium]